MENCDMVGVTDQVVNIKQEKTTVGQRLFRARQEGPEQDLERISEELCIRVHLLMALEQDDFNKFPSACYAAGFLKNYAAYLELDVPRIIGQYKKEFQGSAKKVDLVFLQVEERHNPIQKMVVSAGIMGALVLSGIGYSLRDNDSPPLLPNVAEVTSNILVATIADDQKRPGRVVPEKTPDIAGKKDGDYSLVQQANAMPRTTKKADLAVTTLRPEQLRFTVERNVWVRIQDADRKILVDRVLLSGEEFYLTDRKGMTLMASDAGAVSVLGDNMTALPLGESGEILENTSLDKHRFSVETARLSR